VEHAERGTTSRAASTAGTTNRLEQLNQYEQLVVTNLREELVVIFGMEYRRRRFTPSLVMAAAAVEEVVRLTNKSTTASSQVQQRVQKLSEPCKSAMAWPPAKPTENDCRIRFGMTVRTTVGEFVSDLGRIKQMDR
jgi:transcription elongation GreA/GreB family factor